MTVTTLRPPTAPAVPVVSLRGRVERARDLVRETAGALEDDAPGLSAQGYANLVGALAALEAAAASLRLQVAANAAAARAHEEQAAPDPSAWLASLTGSTRSVMAGGLWLAERLQAAYPQVREAFAAGAMSQAAAHVIVSAAERAPAGVTPEALEEAVGLLVGKATGHAQPTGRPLTPGRLRRAARRMFDHLDAQVAEEHRTGLLERSEQHAEAVTYLQLGDNGDGTWSGRFTIPEAHGRLLASFLQHLSSPRRLGRGPGGRPVSDPTIGVTRNRDEELGAALCETIEHLPTEGWDGKNAFTLVVTTHLDTLAEGLRTGGIETGVDWSAGQVRRAACEAGLLPAVLGGASVPLDLGRTRRLHTTAQRTALRLTYDECAITGCSRPFSWCEVHHPEPWHAGGATSLANAVPLCAWHHHRAHESRWRLQHLGDHEWTLVRATRLHPWSDIPTQGGGQRSSRTT